MQARVGRHLTFEQLVTHLTGLQGREQSFRVSLGPALVGAVPGEAPAAPSSGRLSSYRLLRVINDGGCLNRARSV